LEHHVSVYVPETVYPEYLAPSNDDIPFEDQPLPADASPAALSPGYVAYSDPEEDHVVCLADGGDDDDEEEEQEASDKEDKRLAPTDSFVVPTVDHVPSAEDTEAFKTNESAATPPPPPPVYRTTSRMYVRSQAHIPFPSEAEASLGCRAAMMRAALPSPTPSSPLLLPSTAHIDDLLEAYIPLRKRAHCTAPAPRRFEVGESSVAARQPGSTVARKVDYSFVDAKSEEFYTRHQDAQGDRAALCDEVDTLRRYLSSLYTTHEQERVEAHQALDRSEAHNRALEARITALEVGVRVDTLEDTGSSA
ncbi:hypothetical protein Tco_1510312, partial [Tanacetum coccineum]